MNLVKEAIVKAQEKDKYVYSIEKISEACAVSPSAIYNYMSCRNTPPEVIVSLSGYLHDLGLRDRYCTQECPIGKCKNPNRYTEHDLQTLGFMTGKAIKDMQNVFDTIYQIYADGECDRREQLLFKENILPFLYQTEIVIRNLINIGEGF